MIKIVISFIIAFSSLFGGCSTGTDKGDEICVVTVDKNIKETIRQSEAIKEALDAGAVEISNLNDGVVVDVIAEGFKITIIEDGDNKTFFVDKGKNIHEIAGFIDLICAPSYYSVRISNGTGSLPEYCFGECEYLSNVVIPDSVTSIGEKAFYQCKSLASITIPNSVTSIGDKAFARCESLKSAIISNSVSSIGDAIFEDCFSLNSLTLPESIKENNPYYVLTCFFGNRVSNGIADGFITVPNDFKYAYEPRAIEVRGDESPNELAAYYLHEVLRVHGFDFSGDYSYKEYYKYIIDAVSNGGDVDIRKYEFQDLPQELQNKMIECGDVLMFPEVTNLFLKSNNSNSWVPISENAPEKELLKKVYPNTVDYGGDWSSYATERFKKYCNEECDADPVYCTQDSYSSEVSPNPQFSKHYRLKNVLKVQWQRYASREKISVILVVKNSDGKCLIDNVLSESGGLLFNYAYPPIPFEP